MVKHEIVFVDKQIGWDGSQQVEIDIIQSVKLRLRLCSMSASEKYWMLAL
jgi:hypothetical protein